MKKQKNNKVLMISAFVLFALLVIPAIINAQPGSSPPLGTVDAEFDTISSGVFYDSGNTNYFLNPSSTSISLTTAGKVGIGTTTPVAPLEIRGDGSGDDIKITDSSAPQIQFEDTTAGHDDYWIHVNSGRMYFLWDELDDGSWNFPYTLYFQGRNSYFDNSTLVVDGTNNRVGIGTTGPSKKLHVVDGNGYMTYGDSSGVQVYNAEGSTGEVRLGAAWSRPGVYSTSNLNLLGVNGLALSGRGNNTDLYVNNSGNVGIGIGTSTPQWGAKLEVSNRLNVMGGNDPRLFIGEDGDNYLDLRYEESANRAGITTYDSTQPLSLQELGGRVGIGTISPGSTLDVVGDIKTSADLILSDPAWPSAAGTIRKGTSPFIHNIGSGGLSTFVGVEAGNLPNDGWADTALGANALTSMTLGLKNTAVGAEALKDLTWGEQNTAMGAFAGTNMTTSSRNVAVGNEALYYATTGGDNTALGAAALWKTNTGYGNTAVGSMALADNTTGLTNIAVGDQTLFNNVSGSNNVAIGTGAGYANSTGSSNVFIGHNAGWSTNSSNKLYIDNSSTASPLIYGDFSSNYIDVNGTLYTDYLYDSGNAWIGGNLAMGGTIGYYSRYYTNVTVYAGSVAGAYATCPANTQMTGCGFYWSWLYGRTYSSYPDPNYNRCYASFKSYYGYNRTGTVYANCHNP